MSISVAKISKLVIYTCGCVCSYELYGCWGKQEWNIIPCFAHVKDMEQRKKEAEEDFLNIARQFLTEHEAIRYLSELGYIITTGEAA